MVSRFINNPRFVGFLSLIVFIFWFFFVFWTAPEYQAISGIINATTEGPLRGLAMIEVLFPEFWIMLIVFSVICFISFRSFKETSWLHMLLLGELSLMLFFTPFLLGGFSWSPDSLWHGGVANYIPEIFAGLRPTMTHYAQAYPFSFMTSYFAQQILGIGVFNYTLYVYPVFFIILIPELAYIFASRILNKKTAFLSMLMTLPAWHYFEGHVSPYSFGTILVFFILILLTSDKREAIVLSLVSTIILVATHPISPIALGVFLFAVISINFLLKIQSEKKGFVPKSSLLPIFLFLCIVWFSWTFFQAMNYYPGVEISVRNVLNFNFLNRIIFASEFTGGSASFILPEIHQLTLAIYGILILVLLIGFKDLLDVFRNKLVDFVAIQKRLTLSLASIIYALMGFLLFLSSGERFLLGRGLLFFLFMGFMVIANYFLSLEGPLKKLRKVVPWILVLFLLSTFPLISYSKEAYNTFTPTSDFGLSFLGENLSLSDNVNISIVMGQQLASYVDLNQNFSVWGLVLDLEKYKPDIVVWRINGYFTVSMRYDMSFDDNRYLELRDRLATNENYNKIYANPDFEIYIRKK